MRNKNLLALICAAALSNPLAAATIELTSDGAWYAFDVDDLTSADGGLGWIDLTDGEQLEFTFTLTTPGVLRIVDGGFAGDTYAIALTGGAITTTNMVPSAPAEPGVGLDFDAAFADHARFSFAEAMLAPGTYTLSGSLLQSATDGFGTPFNASVGAVSLTAVPLPASGLLLLGASGLLATRRRQPALTQTV